MKKVSTILIGAGARGIIYSSYAIKHPDELQVVAVAEPDDFRRNYIKDKHGIPDDMCFSAWKEVLSLPKFADSVMICTQDKMHYEPAMAAIEKGYHILLEKPISPSPRECIEIAEAANAKGVNVVVCHVLRYTSFFSKIKEIIDSGAIGDVVSIMHSENVGFYHQAHSFVRGNWRNSRESSPMILAKSCHDTDIIQWLIGRECLKISSFGSLKHFRRENAPENTPDRCIEGCREASRCPYDAVKFYLREEKNNPWFSQAVTGVVGPSEEQIEEALKNGPYGRCVYKCDNDVVDHQVVNMQFEDDITVSFTMSAFTPQIDRTIKIMGTKGELGGKMGKEMSIVLHDFLTKTEKKIECELPASGGHGGGDVGIMKAFCRLLNGNYSSNALSDISISATNHMLSFAAEESRISGRVIDIKEFSKFVMS